MLPNFFTIEMISTIKIHNVKNGIIVLITSKYLSTDILEKDVNELDNDSTKKAKQFFHACMNLSKYIQKTKCILFSSKIL